MRPPAEMKSVDGLAADEVRIRGAELAIPGGMTVVEGATALDRATVDARDPESAAGVVIELRADDPRTVQIPAPGALDILVVFR